MRITATSLQTVIISMGHLITLVKVHTVEMELLAKVCVTINKNDETSNQLAIYHSQNVIHSGESGF